MYNKFHFVQEVGNLDLDLFFTQKVNSKKEAATIVKDLLENPQVTTADYSFAKGNFDNDVKSALDFTNDRGRISWLNLITQY